MELTRKLKIENDLGLHGRAAAKVVELKRKFKSALYFSKNGQKEIDGGNILSILTLSCGKGTEIEAKAVGEDAEELLLALNNLFINKFGEGK